MSWVCTSIPPNEDIKPLFGRDETKTRESSVWKSWHHINSNLLFVLCLRTFTDTARDSRLEFVRRSNTLISLFQSNCHTNTVPNAEAAPIGTDTTLNIVS